MMKRLHWQYKSLKLEFKYHYNTLLSRLRKNELRRKPIIRFSQSGNVEPDFDRPVCFFCSYDPRSNIKQYVYYYLDALKSAGFDIVFISASDTVSATDLAKLSNLCIQIINKENRGYDFYGWKIGLSEYPSYRSHKALLLTNDSILGPLFEFCDIIPKLDNIEADLIGMTDSLYHHPHLQSYFLYCKKTVVTSPEFIGFFNNMEVLSYKMAIIRKYEIGFSKLLSRRFKLAALYSIRNAASLLQRTDKPKHLIDPTHDLWKPLITELGFPFLKRRVAIKRRISETEIAKIMADSNAIYPMDVLLDHHTN